MWTLMVFLMLVFGSSAIRRTFSERSVQDSGYSIMAQQVMKTAMKLPPHILPTLDELDSKSDRMHTVNNIGVYVPHKKRNVGIYIPKNSQTTSQLTPSHQHHQQPQRPTKIVKRPRRRPNKQQQQPLNTQNSLPSPQKPPAKVQELTPARHRRKIPIKVPVIEKKPIFSVELEPNSALGKIYDFTQTGPQEILNKLPKVTLRKPAPGYLLPKGALGNQQQQKKPKRRMSQVQQGHQGHQRRNSERPRQQQPRPPPQQPYHFEDPLESSVLYEEASRLHYNHQMTDRMDKPESNLHKYIPNVLKVALAKSFLKEPEKYIERLYSQKDERERERDTSRPGPPYERITARPPHEYDYADYGYGADYDYDYAPEPPARRPVKSRKKKTKPKGGGGVPLPPQPPGEPPKPPKINFPPPKMSMGPKTVQTLTPARGPPRFRPSGYNTDWKNNIVQPFIPTFEDFQTGSHLGWNLKQRPQTESQQLDNVKNDDRKDNIAAVQVVENNYKGRHTSSPNVHQTDDHTHLCFCCEENELRPFFAQDLQRRKKRTVRIDNPEHSKKIMHNKEYIGRNMECINQEPIEVILVFDEHNKKKKTSNRRMDDKENINFLKRPPKLPPQISGALGQNYLDYEFDPVKLSYLSEEQQSAFLKRKSEQISDYEDQIASSDVDSRRRPIAISYIEKLLENELLGPKKVEAEIDGENDFSFSLSREKSSSLLPNPSPSSPSEKAAIAQNSLMKSYFHQNVPLAESPSKNDATAFVDTTENLYKGYNMLRLLTGG